MVISRFLYFVQILIWARFWPKSQQFLLFWAYNSASTLQFFVFFAVPNRSTLKSITLKMLKLKWDKNFAWILRFDHLPLPWRTFDQSIISLILTHNSIFFCSLTTRNYLDMGQYLTTSLKRLLILIQPTVLPCARFLSIKPVFSAQKQSFWPYFSS